MIKRLIILLSVVFFFQIVSGADYCRVAKFILEHEGGYAELPNDPGGKTNKGITIVVWEHYFGTNAFKRFLKMEECDWNYVFASGYWEAIRGNEIQSLEVAEILVEWAWTSGAKLPVTKIQRILKLPETGIMDDRTVRKINHSDAEWLWKEITKERIKFLVFLTYQRLSDRDFIKGWLNRAIDLVFFQFQFHCEINNNQPDSCE